MKRFCSFFLGILTGSILFCGTAAYAAGIAAEPGTNTFYVDGEKVDVTAYTIFGHNYLKLRDVGQAVGFNVYWDAAAGTVQVERGQPYTGMPPAAGTAPESGKEISCPDGTRYEIRDESRRTAGLFSGSPGDLPEPQCDWSRFPAITVEPETRHFANADEDILFVKNIRETQRMIGTLYNLIGTNEETWNSGQPLAAVDTGIDSEAGVQSFWPWRESELVRLFESRPLSRYTVEAWDCYSNGVFQYTRYLVRSL